MPEGLLKELPPPPNGKSGFPWTQESELNSKGELEAEQYPRLSIVTPSFNQGQFIEETIRSVLLQNYPNLEYIVIDGGSTDGTKQILAKYSGWISYWTSETDRGQTHALNKGMQLASGEVLAYINSDDYYLPGAFAHATKALIDSQADVFAGEVLVVPDNQLFVKPKFETLYDWIYQTDCSIGQPGAFWRRVKDLPSFDESLDYVFDREFFMQLAARNVKFVTSEEVVAAFRLHGDSKSFQYEERFYRENQLVNERYIAHLKSPDEQRQLRAHLRVQDVRRRFHRIENLSGENFATIGSVIKEHPPLVFKREFYGKIKLLLASQK